jgi:hypothetical protein
MNANFVPSPLIAVGVFMKNNKDVCQEENPNLLAPMDLITALELIGFSTLPNVKESPDHKLLTISLMKNTSTLLELSPTWPLKPDTLLPLKSLTKTSL